MPNEQVVTNVRDSLAFVGMILIEISIIDSFYDNQARVLPKRTQSKCQQICYSNNVCMLQMSLDVLLVIGMVKEGFHVVGTYVGLMKN